MRQRVLLAALVVASASAGCTHRPPTFEVVDVQMTDRSADAYVLTFVVEGRNENDIPLRLESMRYSLSMDGRRVFSGTRVPQATLPARGTQVMEVPASIPSDRAPAMASATSYRIGAEVVYELPGSIAEVLFDAKIRRPSTSFSESGTITFDRE